MSFPYDLSGLHEPEEDYQSHRPAYPPYPKSLFRLKPRRFAWETTNQPTKPCHQKNALQTEQNFSKDCLPSS